MLVYRKDKPLKNYNYDIKEVVVRKELSLGIHREEAEADSEGEGVARNRLSGGPGLVQPHE
jgi:hypothetical protein